MSYVDKYHVNELTPICNIGGMYFKRDDLYMPFDDIPLSGGKVRQCISLIGKNLDYIQNECNSHVVTASSISSPQGIITTRVAKDFGLDSTVFVGATNENSLKRHILMNNIINQGGKINYESKMAYDSVLSYNIKQKIEHGEKMFHIKFGLNLEWDSESILDSIGNQVQNLPKNLDYLIVPCGSCIIFSGIIKGLKKYEIYPKHIVGIQISGYDRTSFIEKILGETHLDYEFLISKDYPYSKHIKHTVGSGEGRIQLDWLYEGKAFDYVIKYMKDDIRGKKCCFWLVGNSTPVRTHVY